MKTAQQLREQYGVGYDKFTVKDPLSRGNLNVHVCQFESTFHVVETIDGIQKDGNLYSASQRSTNYIEKPYADEWTFGEAKNLKTTQQWLSDGTITDSQMDIIKEMREEFKKNAKMQEIFELAETKKRRRVWSEAGSELDIDRVLSGDPEHWVSMPAGKSEKVVRLYVKCGFTGGYSADTSLKFGAAAVVAAEALTAAGFFVEIYGVNAGRGSNKNTSWSIGMFKVKDAQEQLDIQRVAALGHTGLFRHYAFCTRENLYDGRPNSGLGASAIIPDSVREALGMNIIIDNNYDQRLFIEQVYDVVMNA